MDNSFNYLDWVELQKSNIYTITREDEDHLILDTDKAKGAVTIYHLEADIVELRITDKATNEDTFFLHFELQDETHAKQLFNEMVQSLIKQQAKKEYHILLSCTSGLTTSYFAEQLGEAARTMNLPYSFEAVSITDVYTAGKDKDMILLAPQVSYMRKKVSAVHHDKPVLVIPAGLFGTYNTGGVLDFVRENLQPKKKEQKLEEHLPEEMDKLTDIYNVLSVAAFLDAGKLRFSYQIFEQSKLVRHAEILKDEYDLNDIKDLLDSVFAVHPEINLVHMIMSGAVKHGKVTLPEMKIYDKDMKKWAEDTYQRRFIFANDIETITAGWYMTHPESKNICVFVGADGSIEGSIGTVIDGHVIGGKNNSAGLITGFSRLLSYSENPWYLAKTPEGTAEIVAKYLLAAIYINAPEKVIIFSRMITETDTVSTLLTRYLPDHMIPEIILAGDYHQYVSIGALAHCIKVIQNGWAD